MSRARAMARALALAALPSAVLAAEKPAPTIKDLQARPIEVRPDARVEASAARAMENYRRFLELQQSDPQLRAEALRRLGDLKLEAGELERMEKEVTTLDLPGAEAIALYETLLRAHPDYPRNDQVLYQLARAYETTGQPERALVTLERIVGRYPGSPQLEEVQFRRGEILFSARRYAEAEAAYATVIARGQHSPFYGQSLYKHGWSLFKQSLNQECLPSFAQLLDSVLADARHPDGAVRIEALPRAERELVEDTLRVMSITFSYLEGAETLDRFVARRAPMPYAHLLYARLGDLYVEKQRYQDAAGAYLAFVEREPNSDIAPGLATRAIEAYRRGGFEQLVLEGKRQYVERYGFSQPFWAGRERGAARHADVVRELRASLRDLARYHHAAAQRSKRIEDFQQAARWYRDYLQSFPDDPEAAATNYLFAETLFESRQYADAAREFERTAYGYPRSDRSAAAGYAALVALEKETERLDGEARDEWQRRSIDAGVKFAHAFPEHPDSVGMLTRAAQQLFALGDPARAMQLSEQVLARGPVADAAKRRIAWTLIGQGHFDRLAFAEAEAAFLEARALVPPADPLQADLTERIAAAVYRQAEASRSSGDAAAAVEHFLRVGRVASDSKIRATAEFDAAAQLIQLRDWERAIEVLEAHRREFPQGEFSADVTRNLAVAYLESGRPGPAAGEFERIAATAAEEPAARREATLQAAELYEKSGNDAKSAAMLEQFVREYPTPPVDAIEARQRLAELAARAGDAARRRHWQQQIVLADREAGSARTERTRVLAAKAQLALAEVPREAFRNVRLRAPLKASLARKRSALEAALEGYKAAAAYGVGEVTTAATYEMAELYRGFGRDLMESERPQRLSAEELEQYDLLLEEQAFPFEEQAIAMHEVNIGRVREGLYDEAVKKSFAALAALEPGRYGKSEVLQDVATALLGPPPAVAGFERALGHLRAGDSGAAERVLEQLAHDYPDLPGPLVSLGILQRKAGRLEEAERSLRAAVRAAPAHAPAWTELGVVLRMSGRFQDALGAYEQALAADPGHAAAHRNLGVLCDLYLGDAERALVAFERYKALSGLEDRQLDGWIAELRQRVGRPIAPAPHAPAVQPAQDAPTEPAPGASP